MANILLATTYIGSMLLVMSTFSYFWRRRKNAKEDDEPWFSEHRDRDVYMSLLEADPPASELVLKAALLRRAMTDVQRAMRLNEDKQALMGLIQRGAVGDDLWTSLQEAEKEMQREVLDVVAEANTFGSNNWGQYIFQNAQEMVFHQRIKDVKADAIELKEKEEKAAKRREEKEKIEAEEYDRKEKARVEKERKKAQEELLKDEEAQKKKKTSEKDKGKGKKK